jgi:hypothetical protein
MSKPYIKPTIKIDEIPVQLLRMWSIKGCIEVFDEERISRRKEDPDISDETIFNDLNQSFCKLFGDFRFSSYDSFRQIMKRER